jgi:hypothetical protein
LIFYLFEDKFEGHIGIDILVLAAHYISVHTWPLLQLNNSYVIRRIPGWIKGLVSDLPGKNLGFTASLGPLIIHAHASWAEVAWGEAIESTVITPLEQKLLSLASIPKRLGFFGGHWERLGELKLCHIITSSGLK